MCRDFLISRLSWDYWRHLPRFLRDLALPQISKLLPEHDDSDFGNIRHALVANDRLWCAERSRKLEFELHEPVECNDGVTRTRTECVLNLRTAKSLGLTIPPSILLRADEVVD